MKQMRKTFKNDLKETQFKKDGYVIVDLLSESEADYLRNFFQENEKKAKRVFYTTTSTLDKDYRLKMDSAIRRVTHEKLNTLLVDYEVLYASYIVKKRGFKARIDLHADWQFTEEPTFPAMNVWIALNDLRLRSGTLKVVPASHKLVDQLRGPNYRLKSELYKQEDNLVTLPLKKGQAVIYDIRLLHASANNLLKDKRIVASALVVPKEAPSIYHYFNEKIPEQPEFIHEVDRKFYIEKCDFTANNDVWNYTKPD